MPTDPAIWAAIFGFFGVTISTLGLILIELIRNRRRTENVNQEVLNAKDSADTQLVSLAENVTTIKERLDDHIRWHLETASPYMYLRHRENRRNGL